MSAIEDLLLAHVRDSREKIAAAVASVDALETMIKRLDKISLEPPQSSATVRKLNGWSEAEDKLLREQYPILGPRGCQKLLPHRSQLAIRSHCSRVLKVARLPSARRLWCDQCDAKVTQGQVACCQDRFCAGKQKVIEGGLNP